MNVHAGRADLKFLTGVCRREVPLRGAAGAGLVVALEAGGRGFVWEFSETMIFEAARRDREVSAEVFARLELVAKIRT